MENQSLPLSSLGDQEDKNIYGQFSSLWGWPGTEQNCFFPWLWLTPQDRGSWDKHRLFTRSKQPQRDTVTYSFPFFNRDVSFWKVAQRNKGGFLSSVSLVLGGVEETFFFFPERWRECVLVNNMFPIICLLKTQGNLRMWLKQPGQRASWRSYPSFPHRVSLLELNKHLLTE